jgi:hypothetical protein
MYMVKEERKLLNTRKKGRLNGLSTSCLMNTLLKEREKRKGRGRRSKQLLDKPKTTRKYWELKEEAVEGPVRGIRFGRGCRPVAIQTA